MDDMIKITGVIEWIRYANSDNGYTVCDIDSDDHGTFTATGFMPYVSEGETVCVTGVWTTHPDYGDQLKVSYYESVLPSDEEAIISYLGSGIVSGIRMATAKRLVEHFGTEVLTVMLANPERLSEVKGISKEKAAKIGDSFAELQAMQGIVMFLQQYHVSPGMAMKVYQALGPNAVDLVKQNPYVLSEQIEGITFKTADTIAFTRGLPKNNPERIKAGLKYILMEAAYTSGHTYLPKSVLIEHAGYTLQISAEEAENCITALALDKNMCFDTVDKTEVCYLSSFYNAELYIARRLVSMSQYEQKFTMQEAEIEDKIDEVQKKNQIILASNQRDAVITAISSGVMVLTGGPGTGKTTAVKTIIDVMESMKLKIALAAPTGRAAKRLTEVTGIEAKTIHRLLGAQPGEQGLNTFMHHENDPLTADVVIVDEMSMIDVLLMHSFLRAVKTGARLIIVGDADQLPSVGAGNVLRDIIASKVVPVVRLDRIFRQAEESLIIVNAHKINKGEPPEINEKTNDFFFIRRPTIESVAMTIVDLYKNRLPRTYELDPFSQIQVLSPVKKGIAGVINLNREIQKHLNPETMLKNEYTHGSRVFREGDKIMQIKNNYDIPWERENGEVGMGIFNGDMGIIKSISTVDKRMQILFDDDKEVGYDFNNLDELELAYAITVHKSQGSEFPYVIMPVCSFMPMLMNRNLFYTAVTRAKDMVVLVGSEKTIYNMVQNNTERERFTGLCERLVLMNQAVNTDIFSEDNTDEII